MAHNRRFSNLEVEVAFKKMPTFTDNKIDLSDMDAFLKTLGYTCSKEQMDGYKEYIRDSYNGKLVLEDVTAAFAVIDDAKEIMKIHVVAMDKDKNGFIDEAEFKSGVKVLLIHDPSLNKIDYAKFVQEADTNKDGKVSIAEAVEWFCKNAKK